MEERTGLELPLGNKSKFWPTISPRYGKIRKVK